MSKTKIDINVNAITAKYKNYSSKANMILKNEVVRDTDPYVPMNEGYLKNSPISSINNSEKSIVYRSPYARYLYHGKVMVSPSGSPYAKAGEKKVATNKNINFRKTYHPKATHKWFEFSKKQNLKKWLSIVKKVYK